jgi:hypothetical protein
VARTLVAVVASAAVLAGCSSTPTARHSTTTTLPTISTGAYLAQDAQDNNGDWRVCSLSDEAASETETGQWLSANTLSPQTIASVMSSPIRDDTAKLASLFRVDLTQLAAAPHANSPTSASAEFLTSVLTPCKANGYLTNDALPVTVYSTASPSTTTSRPSSTATTTAPPTTIVVPTTTAASAGYFSLDKARAFFSGVAAQYQSVPLHWFYSKANGDFETNSAGDFCNLSLTNAEGESATEVDNISISCGLPDNQSAVTNSETHEATAFDVGAVQTFSSPAAVTWLNPDPPNFTTS